MDITLHMGAHRTATTNFQTYMTKNAETLSARGLAFWGPDRTRSGLFTGLIGRPDGQTPERVKRGQRATGLIRLESARLLAAGYEQLIVSEENMIGSIRNNLRSEELYPDVFERLSQFRVAFGERCKRIVLMIRDYDSYWASATSFAISRGFALPDTDMLDRLTTQPRRWRAVIEDIAAAFPNADVLVLPFSRFAGLPANLCEVMTGSDISAPRTYHQTWYHRGRDPKVLRDVLRARGMNEAMINMPSSDGLWAPFDAAQTEMLRAVYDEDLAWLRSGAGGLAHLVEEPQSGWTTHEDTGKLARAMKPTRERPNALPKLQSQMG